ncbi:MAG: hypothetical protein ABR95_00375 [Sphingobacteriales bacterium BACL12 MAG-120813-bin55]|jgi:uncharacterized Ntn-hydrolase superfamily protein|nr:MAG: hypothetical protein ABR94_10995 [Sphingobacteriales bacterium BACL12 MAG-120802-bin5]KRP13398.1 MAG: hypothetical protein ABR95_00375 [Sphingobacteriales bacterium BACL12 MAG-120813-bin55]
MAAFGSIHAQDTFSIVAVDSVTGEVGSAGASCVNLSFFPGYPIDFLGELFPGLGAINTQAYYLAANQQNAAERMEAGDTPEEIIDWLVANDVEGNPTIRQYGVVAFVGDGPQSAAHTGASTDDYKGHRTGATYSIQGNILLGPEILDSMEARFLAEEGDLACKLMAAMQGANIIGADTRCAGFGTSSLFAFLKVAQTDDLPGNPSLLVAVKTTGAQGIEPIDSLQVLFNAAHSCLTGTNIVNPLNDPVTVYPNPTGGTVTIHGLNPSGDDAAFMLFNLEGKQMMQVYIPTESPQYTIELGDLPSGNYVYYVQYDGRQHNGTIVIE